MNPEQPMRRFKTERALFTSMSAANLVDRLNEALGWELRAMTMYAHYAANVQGIHRLQLDPMFNEEATESLAHADVVRRAVVKLGGVPVTERNDHPIVHTTDYKACWNVPLRLRPRPPRCMRASLTCLRRSATKRCTTRSSKFTSRNYEVWRAFG